MHPASVRDTGARATFDKDDKRTARVGEHGTFSTTSG